MQTVLVIINLMIVLAMTGLVLLQKSEGGGLGMGGGGIANVGRPDKSVTTHEFGHAF